MDNKDLHNKLNQVIQEEIRSVLAEREYKFGGLLDPKNFDPIDPEVHIAGYGTMVVQVRIVCIKILQLILKIKMFCSCLLMLKLKLQNN